MVEFKNEQDFEDWLKDKPKDWAVLLSSRAALRVLPALAGLAQNRATASANIFLPFFHGMALPWAAAKYPALGNERRFYTAASAALSASAARSALSASAARSAASAALSAARSAASASALSASALSAASAARSAALSAASALSASALSAAWKILSVEAAFLEQWGPEKLAAENLWLDPGVFHYESHEGLSLERLFLEKWNDFAIGLRSVQREDWGVWTLWYDAILGGEPSPWPETVNNILLDNDLWERNDPVEINGAIRAAMKAQPPAEIPPPLPAAIEPIVSNDKLTLPKSAADSDLKGQTLGAALKALREQIEKLADDYENSAPNPDVRAVAWLRSLAARVPKARPKQTDLFAFGHERKVLESYTKTANAEWPEILAARYHAMTLAFDRTLKQFPKWREFLRNASTETLSAEQIADVHDAATQVAAVLRAEDALPHVDPPLPDTIDALNERLESRPSSSEILADIDAAKQELAADLIEGINNVFKKIAETALAQTIKKAAKGFGQEAAKSIIKEGKRLGKGVGPGMTKWAKRILVGGFAYAGGLPLIEKLIANFPAKFGWLEAILTILKLT